MLKHYKRRSLKAKLAFWSATAMVVVVLAVTSFTLWVLRSDMTRNAADVQATLADSLARDLDARIADRRLALQQSASVLGADLIGRPDALREHFASRPVVQGMFDSLIVVDRDGRMAFDSPELAGRVGRSVADRTYFKEVMATGRTVVSEPVAGKATAEPNIVFAAPLRNAAGETVGALCGILYLTRPNFLSELGQVKVGKAGYVAVVAKGESPVIVMHGNRERIMTRLPPPASSPLVYRALSGEEGTFEGVNSVGLEALYTFRHLKNVPWLVTTVYPVAEARAQLRDSERLVVALGLALMVLAGIGIGWLVDRLLAPLDHLRSAMLQSRDRSEPVVVDVRDETHELFAVVDAYNTLMAHTHEARAAVQRSEAHLRLITDHLPAQIVHFDEHGRYTFVNAHVARDMNVAPASLLGRTVREVRGERVFRQIEGHLAAALRGASVTFEGDYEYEGRISWFRSTYVPEVAPDGRVRGVFAMTQNISAQKRAEQRLAASEKRLRMIADNLPVLISYVDDEERMQFANETYRVWAGVDPVAAIGRKVSEVVSAELYEERREALQTALSGRRVEFDLVSMARGRRRHLHTVYVPDVREDGRVAGLYALSTDVTALKDVEERLNELARVDPLTGLPNRRAFDERLQASVARHRRGRQRLALLFLDVDHFKEINDTHGHGTGDEVLREFARRLLSCVRQTDTVARLAGDEFVIILEGLRDLEEATSLAAKIGLLMRLPFQVGGEIRRVTASIGVAYVDDPRIQVEDIVAKADGALYRAKRNGRDTFAVSTF